MIYTLGGGAECLGIFVVGLYCVPCCVGRTGGMCTIDSVVRVAGCLEVCWRTTEMVLSLVKVLQGEVFVL